MPLAWHAFLTETCDSCNAKCFKTSALFPGSNAKLCGKCVRSQYARYLDRSTYWSRIEEDFVFPRTKLELFIAEQRRQMRPPHLK